MNERNSNRATDFKRIVRALSSRNYRLFFAGQLISLIGTWLTRVATGWLAYRLTGSPLVLGIVGFAGQIPTFLFAPFAGVLVDRWNRHRVLVVTQCLAMLQSLALAYFAITQTVTVTHLIVLGVAQGLINALDMPARQAFVVEMVEKREDLSNAIALNSTLVNAARLLGPSLAGILISAFGEGWCFLIDGVSYIAVILALLAMRVNRDSIRRKSTRMLDELREGYKYAFGFIPMRSILILLAVMSLTGVPYTVLMPVFAKDILHGGPSMLGFLMGVSGMGALGGAIFLAARKSVRGLGRVILISTGTFGVGLIIFAYSTWPILSAAMMAVTGFTMILQMAAGNTVLQTIVDDEHRGRVMSFFTMSVMGTVPIGTLAAGAVAPYIGTPATVASGGVLCVAGSLWFARQLPEIRRLLRPIYVKQGIIVLPEVAEAVDAATDVTGRGAE